MNFYNLVVFVENNLNLTSDFYFENNIYFKGLNFCDLNSYIESVLNEQSELCRDYSSYISISLLESNQFDNIFSHFENISRKEVK